MGEECKGVEIQPMSQERRHSGGKQGRAAVTGSPDRGGIHALSGAIDTSRLLWYFSVCPKSPCIFPIPNKHPVLGNGEKLNPLATKGGHYVRGTK